MPRKDWFKLFLAVILGTSVFLMTNASKGLGAFVAAFGWLP
jgi:hypothetical protein